MGTKVKIAIGFFMITWYALGLLGSAISSHDEVHRRFERLNISYAARDEYRRKIFLMSIPSAKDGAQLLADPEARKFFGFHRSPEIPYDPEVERLDYGFQYLSYYGWATVGAINLFLAVKEHFRPSPAFAYGKWYALSPMRHWGITTEWPLPFYTTHSH